MAIRYPIKWALVYRLLTIGALVAGILLVAVGLVAGFRSAVTLLVDDPLNPSSAIDRANPTITLVFFGLGLLVWQFGTAYALFLTLPRVAGRAAANRLESNEGSRESLEQLDERLEAMESDIVELRREVQALEGLNDRPVTIQSDGPRQTTGPDGRNHETSARTVEPTETDETETLDFVETETIVADETASTDARETEVADASETETTAVDEDEVASTDTSERESPATGEKKATDPDESETTGADATEPSDTDGSEPADTDEIESVDAEGTESTDTDETESTDSDGTASTETAETESTDSTGTEMADADQTAAADAGEAESSATTSITDGETSVTIEDEPDDGPDTQSSQ